MLHKSVGSTTVSPLNKGVGSTTVSPLNEAYFKLLKGYSLTEWLTDQRDLGHSYRTIATRLNDVTDGTMRVSYRTIARWVGSLEKVAS